MRPSILAALLLLLAPAHAAAARYALLVGNNLGHGLEVPLRYAEADAARLSEVLVEIGGFEPGKSKLLRSPSAAELERAFAETVAQIAADGARDALLIFYYSGHADGASLHLGDGSFELTRLRDLLAGSGAAVRVGILDACGSGALTARDKGLVPREPFLFSAPPELAARGQVLLASSSASEAAQESDTLRGSFFTTYLVSGLRGAADRSGTGRVTLDDAFRFARAQTVRATLLSRSGTQHPSYAMDLAGQGDVVLTEPQRGRARLVLRAETKGEFALFDASERLVAQVFLNAGDEALLALPPGTYDVHKRSPESLRLAKIELGSDEERVLAESRMDQLRYVPLARKGVTPSVGLSGGWAVGILSQPTGAALGRVSVDLAYERWVFTPRIQGSYCAWTTAAPASAAVHEGLLSVGLAATRRWEKGRGELRAGAAVDVAGLEQSYFGNMHLAGGVAGSVVGSFGLRLAGNTSLVLGLEPGVLLRPSPETSLHPFFLADVGVRIGF